MDNGIRIFDQADHIFSLGSSSPSDESVSCSTKSYPTQEHVTVLPSKVVRESDGSFRANPDSPTHWTAQPVLQWLESLAHATEAAGGDPLIVNGVRLSESSFPPVTLVDSKPCAVLSMLSDGDQSPKTKCIMFQKIEYRDPDGWWNIWQMEGLARLVNDNVQLQGSYRSIHERFYYTFDQIMRQTKTIGFESRYVLDTLYHETITKLQDLLDKSTTLRPEGDGLPRSISADSPVKKDLAEIMTNWLVDNWTNPYPDEDGLATLAAETETSPSVVGNWLINARTRKWRPSIVKASKYMERPASLLLEDSINIFSGRPLRPLEEDVDDDADSSSEGNEFESCRMLVTSGAFYPPIKRLKSVKEEREV